MKNMWMAACLGVCLTVLTWGVSVADRAYDPAQLQTGKRLYEENCAVCHGADGEGAPNWHRPNAEGKLPAPPLNGTGHTWHHSVRALFQTISQGTETIGGSMPAWRGKLSPDQILLIINWITSLWPDEVYRAWREEMARQQ